MICQDDLITQNSTISLVKSTSAGCVPSIVLGTEIFSKMDLAIVKIKTQLINLITHAVLCTINIL